MIHLKLDIKTTYGYQDKEEVFWKFTFESIVSDEGWWAWMKRPNFSDTICIGRISEREIIKKLKEIPPPLSQDDEIDFRMWMLKGGGQEYIKGE